MQLDALWTLEYATNQGDYGTGVVILVDGHIFGGDSNYAYEGSYQTSGDTIDASVRLSLHHTGSGKEPPESERMLRLRGRRVGRLIELTGGPAAAELRLCVQLSFRSPLAPGTQLHGAGAEMDSGAAAGYMIGESSDRLPLF